MPPVEASAPCPEPVRPFVLAATIVASAMAFVDGSALSIALPELQRDLDTNFSLLQWVVNSYALLLGGLILIGGASGDRFGRRRVFMLGIGLFGCASIACALAPSVTILIAARSVQGIGAALLVPQSLAIISASFPKSVRGRAIGIWAGASAITTAAGPPLSGFLIDAASWRAIFWLNVPFSIAALWLSLRFVPESRNEDASGPVDWLGGSVAIAALGMLTVGVSGIDYSNGVTSSVGPALIGLGFVGLILFTWIETRAVSPLLPILLFRSATFSAANLITLLLYAALSGVLFLLPFDLIARRGMSPTEVGFVLLPFGLIIGVLSRRAGSFADKYGPRLPLVAGAGIVAIASLMLALQAENVALGVVTPVIALSLGMAFVAAPLTTAVMNSVPEANSGSAAGINNTASRLAALFAVAILGTVANFSYFRKVVTSAPEMLNNLTFGQFPAVGTPGRAVIESAFSHGYSMALAVAALWALISAFIAFLFLRPTDGR